MRKNGLQDRYLISWNLNGIRAVHEKGLLAPLFSGYWDIIALQETKVRESQIDLEIARQPGYRAFWASSLERKGYSGTALFIRTQLAERARILNMTQLIGDNPFDLEGRSLIVDFGSFALINCYFPHSQENGRRLPYKLAFNRAVYQCCEQLSHSHKRPVILCGDFNVAAQEIDLARPNANLDSPGFLPEERAWMQKFLAQGYIDSFRYFYPNNTAAYTWWSYRNRARANNVGWRIDYFCINQTFAHRLVAADILYQAEGSDHCPVCVRARL